MKKDEQMKEIKDIVEEKMTEEEEEIDYEKEYHLYKKGFELMKSYFSMMFACLSEHTIHWNTELAINQMHDVLSKIEERDSILANEMKELLVKYRDSQIKDSNLVDPTKGMDWKTDEKG